VSVITEHLKRLRQLRCAGCAEAAAGHYPASIVVDPAVGTVSWPPWGGIRCYRSPLADPVPTPSSAATARNWITCHQETAGRQNLASEVAASSALFSHRRADHQISPSARSDQVDGSPSDSSSLGLAPGIAGYP